MPEEICTDNEIDLHGDYLQCLQNQSAKIINANVQN